MSENTNVIAVFDKFGVLVDGKVVLYDDLEGAETAAIMSDREEEIANRCAAYCEDAGLEGKNATGKSRIIREFICFEAKVAARANGEEEGEVDEAFVPINQR